MEQQIFYKSIEKIWNDSDSNIELVSKTIIPKLNNTKYPFVYHSLKDKYKSFKEFSKWYQNNTQRLMVKSFLTKTQFQKINKFNLISYAYENPFMSLDVIYEIESNDLEYSVYKKDNITVHIYNKVINGEKYDIGLVVKIINFIRKYKKSKKELELIIFLGSLKKEYPIKGNILTSKNVNSGMSQNDCVCIWRREELYKVLIHELIHYYDLDFSKYDLRSMETYVKKLLNYDGFNAINETYTEILAINIYYVIISIIKLNNNYEKYLDLINKERLYMHYQISSIIKHFGGKNYEDLFKIKIKQSTSVVAYYIIKGMMFNNNKDMIKYYVEGKYDLKTYEKIFYKNITENGLDKKMINYFIENPMYDTMRMTHFDL